MSKQKVYILIGYSFQYPFTPSSHILNVFVTKELALKEKESNKFYDSFDIREYEVIEK